MYDGRIIDNLTASVTAAEAAAQIQLYVPRNTADPELDYEPEGCMTDGECKSAFCPEHGEADVWDGDNEERSFLLINGILIAEVDREGYARNGGLVVGLEHPVSVHSADVIAIETFQGPITNYETWREI
jgi:hypothetical protein